METSLVIKAPEAVLVGNPSEAFPVDARRLHAWLGVGRDFSNWIKGRIAEYEFQEGADYSPNLANSTRVTKPSREYLLTFDMAKELAMVERNEKGREARKYFIACERKLKDVAGSQRQWNIARSEGKLSRRVETDVIQRFVTYAQAQGSQSAPMYFVNFSKMVNSALLEIEGKKPDALRDSLNMIQLHSISVAEMIVARTLVECMHRGLPYKTVYQIAKEKISAYGLAVGKSKPGISARESIGLIA